jgi:hypothetical protein
MPADADVYILRKVLALATVVGEFIDPSVYMPLLLPVVRGETDTDIHHRCAAIEVLHVYIDVYIDVFTYMFIHTYTSIERERARETHTNMYICLCLSLSLSLSLSMYIRMYV